MPRVHRHPVPPLAITPAMLAPALGVRAVVVKEAIELGLLPVYARGSNCRKLILVSDAEAWVKSWPRIIKKVKSQ